MTTPACPVDAFGRSECASELYALAAETDVEIHVSTLPPLIVGAYENAGFRCPHGVEYWIEPTGEQVADWVARRTP